MRMSAQKSWAIELLSNCVFVVTNDVKEDIVEQIDHALGAQKEHIVEVEDIEGNTHGFPTNAVVLWYDDPEAIEAIMSGNYAKEAA